MYSAQVVFTVPIMLTYQKVPDQNKELSSVYANNKHPYIHGYRLFVKGMGSRPN